MAEIPVTVVLPISTIRCIRTLDNRGSLSVQEMATLSQHATSASRAVMDAIKSLPGDQLTAATRDAGSPRSLNDPEFLIFVCNSQTGKCFSLKVKEMTLNRDVAEMVQNHEGVPLGSIVSNDRKGKMVYGWDIKAKGSPVKMKQLLQDNVTEGDLLTLSLVEQR